MIVADYQCKKCGLHSFDMLVCSPADTSGPLCCGSPMGWVPSFRGARRKDAAFSDRDAIVVWEGPNGDVRYPGRNDVPIPRRYVAQGYQRRVMKSLREVEKFEREKGVRSQMAWYDKGSGRGAEDGNKYGV